MVKKSRKPLSTRSKLNLLQVGSMVSLLAPMGIVFGMNFNEYFYNYNGTKLSIGCILGLLFTILLVKGKTEMFKGLGGFATVFILAYLFESILHDFVLISGMALLGKGTDTLLFKKPIQELSHIKRVEKDAEIQAKAHAKYNMINTNNEVSGRI